MRQPSVVWIMCDELRTDALSCYGTPFPDVRTPNVDRIAERGVRFANCFSTSPICVPMRASLMTACYPEQTGVYGNEGAWASYTYDRDLPTFPERFAAAGYETVNFGKTHLPRTMQPWHVDDRDGAQARRILDGVELGGNVVTVPNLGVVVGGEYPDGDQFPGNRVTRRAVNWLDDRLERSSADPFLLRVSYLQPHTPVVPPPPHAGRYDHLPWGDPRSDGEAQSEFERRAGDVLGVQRLRPAELHHARASYYELVAWIDEQVGAILDCLEAHGALDDVIVVFNADHGVSLGEGGRMLKHTFAPEAHRIPLIFSAPGRLPQALVRREVCESIDLARTLCALTAVAPDAGFGGRDLFGSEPAGEAFATLGYGLPGSRHAPNTGNGTWSDGGGWPRRSCIRTDRYRLDLNTRRNGEPVSPDEEDPFLADVIADPAERHNRSGDPDLSGVLADLRRRLFEHVAGAYEPSHVPVRTFDEIGTH